MLTHARSRSLTNLFECWNEIEKYKYWNKDCSQTHTEYLREILLDSRGSNVSVQEMMQSLWWWPWWWNRHKQYTKQTYQVQSWWIFLCIAAVKKKKKKKSFFHQYVPFCSDGRMLYCTYYVVFQMPEIWLKKRSMLSWIGLRNMDAQFLI